MTFPYYGRVELQEERKNILDIFIFWQARGKGWIICFKKAPGQTLPTTSRPHGTYFGNQVTRMPQKGRIFIFADKKNSGITHPHTGSTGSAAGSLVDSCTCMHRLSSDSHADTCGYRHTHPYLSGTSTQ